MNKVTNKMVTFVTFKHIIMTQIIQTVVFYKSLV